jgi:hypothetical protein
MKLKLIPYLFGTHTLVKTIITKKSPTRFRHKDPDYVASFLETTMGMVFAVITQKQRIERFQIWKLVSLRKHHLMFSTSK